MNSKHLIKKKKLFWILKYYTMYISWNFKIVQKIIPISFWNIENIFHIFLNQFLNKNLQAL